MGGRWFPCKFILRFTSVAKHYSLRLRGQLGVSRMLPRERRETGTQDMFRSRLDQIINMNHELVRLAKTVSCETIEARCGEVYSDGPGMPPLPTRLMAGLAILKHTFNLSDEDTAQRFS